MDVQLFAGANDTLLEVRELALASTGAIVTTATITASIFDPDGVAVVEDLALAHQGAGLYQAMAETTLTEGERYTVTITATGPGRAQWMGRATAIRRAP